MSLCESFKSSLNVHMPWMHDLFVLYIGQQQDTARSLRHIQGFLYDLLLERLFAFDGVHNFIPLASI